MYVCIDDDSRAQHHYSISASVVIMLGKSALYSRR